MLMPWISKTSHDYYFFKYLVSYRLLQCLSKIRILGFRMLANFIYRIFLSFDKLGSIGSSLLKVFHTKNRFPICLFSSILVINDQMICLRSYFKMKGIFLMAGCLDLKYLYCSKFFSMEQRFARKYFIKLSD